MVQIYSAPKNKGSKGRKTKGTNKHSALTLPLEIESLDVSGQGVASSHQPVVFVPGTLPGERWQVAINEQKKRLWLGTPVRCEQPSAERIEPFCPHYSQCGGCDVQHLSSPALLGYKQAALDASLTRQLQQDKLPWQPAISGPARGYRRKARLAVDARNPDKRQLGFRSSGSNKVVNISQCQILVPELQRLIAPIQAVFQALDTPKNLGHVQLFAADNGVQVVLRIINPLGEADTQAWVDFATKQRITLLLEHRSGEFRPLVDNGVTEAIYHVSQDLALSLGPNDFVQVNDAVNRSMVAQALDWLAVSENDRVLDLFAGAGNFSLPLGQTGAEVLAIEGVKAMVERLGNNADKHGLSNVRAQCRDLAASDSLTDITAITRVILDPARAGALACMDAIPRLRPERVVYVSCNAATFTRDAKALLQQGYNLVKIGVMDMFPCTAHLEVMALFVPDS